MKLSKKLSKISKNWDSMELWDQILNISLKTGLLKRWQLML
jgi:hypothetical protein